MGSRSLIGSIDQGTSSSRFLVFDITTGSLISSHQVPVRSFFPNQGWVEQDPEQIFNTVEQCIEKVVADLTNQGLSPRDIKGIGLCNQRETTIVWDRVSGKPLYNAIIWLDNRTKEIVDNVLDEIPNRNFNFYKRQTGLPISSYFSAFKLKWLMENVTAVKNAYRDKRLCFGTVDTWLLWKLTGEYATDVTNASRTFLMNIETLTWDSDICRFFHIDKRILPDIKPSSSKFGAINHGPLTSVAITGIIGDQQSALIGQRCFNVGQTKVTYGTGCFIVQNIGSGPLNEILRGLSTEAQNSLITTIAYKFGDEAVTYGLEGSIPIAGAAISWLRDNLGLIESFDEIESIASSVDSSADVFFVPAFQGLFAPYWDPNATGLIIGLSQFTNKSHLVRATLESVAFQTSEILALMKSSNETIVVDGGLTMSAIFCQILTDTIGCEIMRPPIIETTALGAAVVATYSLDRWRSYPNDFFSILLAARLSNTNSLQVRHYSSDYFLYQPKSNSDTRDERMLAWKLAVKRSMRWSDMKQLRQRTKEYLNKAVLPFGIFFISVFGLLAISSARV